MSNSVCIAGLGLIGGSLGIALRRRGWSVSYVDPAVPLEAARAAGAADERREAPDGEIVVLATPVDIALGQLASLRGSDAVVTSVCSVMQPLCDAASEITFVAGHPFAGSERRGLEAADGALFHGRPWFLSGSHERIEQLASDAGGAPVVINAAEHDRVMALTSHLPQLVSTALASMLNDVAPQFVGSGAASLLRLAGSSYDVWRPVVESNRGNIDDAIATLLATLRTLSEEDFARARETYSRLRR